MDVITWMVPPNETAKKTAIVVYRSVFHLEKQRKFHLRWTADEHAELFLNGKFLCAGPVGCTRKRWYFEELQQILPPGNYVLTARVTMFGEKLRPFAQESVSFGFHAESVFTEKWECQMLDGVEYTAAFPDWAVSPRMNVSADTNWNILSGTGGLWKPVEFRKDHRPLFPRTIPPMEEKSMTKYKILNQGEKKRLFVFDDYVCVWSDFRFRGCGSVTIRWSESFYHQGTFEKRNLTGDKGDRREFENKEWIGNGTVLHLPGNSVRWRDPEWKSGRYLLLEFSGDAELEAVEFTSTCYPWKRKWYLKTSDPELDSAFELAWNTFRKCSHETFIDCPYFERMQYLSDSRLESLVALAVTRDRRLILQTLQVFADSQAENGLILSRAPSKMPQIIPSFALIYILLLRDVAERHSPALIRKFLPYARKILDYFERESENGLIHFSGWNAVDTPNWKPGDKGWNFIDWVDGWTDGVPPGSCTLNLFRLLALEAMAKLDAENSGFWLKSARFTADAVRRTYEVPGKGFAENSEKTIFTEHAQCLAVISEILPDYSPEIQNAAQCSISFSHYYLEAVRKLGRGDLFRQRLSKWMSAGHSGLYTLPENFGISRSDCHAWSSHILYHAFASILGLQPVDPEKGIWKINPLPCGLSFLEGEVPLGDGSLKFRMEGEKLSLENRSSCILCMPR